MNNDLVSREAVEQIFSKMWFTVRQNQNLTDEEIKQIITKGRMELNRLQPAQQWTPCTPETMPDNEQDVLVTVEIRPVGRKPFRRVVRAFYTDGKHTDADSAYTWYELEEPDFDDDGNIIVPEGWWESSDYSEEVSPIDDFVISWREQPKPQKGEGNG